MATAPQSDFESLLAVEAWRDEEAGMFEKARKTTHYHLI